MTDNDYLHLTSTSGTNRKHSFASVGFFTFAEPAETYCELTRRMPLSKKHNRVKDGWEDEDDEFYEADESSMMVDAEEGHSHHHTDLSSIGSNKQQIMRRRSPPTRVDDSSSNSGVHVDIDAESDDDKKKNKYSKKKTSSSSPSSCWRVLLRLLKITCVVSAFAFVGMAMDFELPLPLVSIFSFLPLLLPSFKTSEIVMDPEILLRIQRDRHGKVPVVLPNLLLIGVQKAGTSAIAEWLIRQEQAVCHPETFEKEPAYFQRSVQFFNQEQRFLRGLGFYSSRFQHCANKTFIMDASPSTLAFPENVRVIYQGAGGDWLENLKVVVVLRDPVARELSLYNHKADEYILTRDQKQWYGDVGKGDGSLLSFTEHADVFLETMNDPEKANLEWGSGDIGFYTKHLTRWLEFVERSKLLVLSYDEFQRFPRTTEDRIQQFLGFNFTGTTQHTNLLHSSIFSQKVTTPSCQAKEKLTEFFQPDTKHLHQLLSTEQPPDAEQKPFPAFSGIPCNDGDTDMKAKTKVTLDGVVLPNLFLAGAHKAGVSALSTWLFENGNVCKPRPQLGSESNNQGEVHFFDKPGQYEKGITFYTKHFEHCTQNSSFIIDATPNTLTFPYIVENVYKMAGGASQDEEEKLNEHLENLKVIVMLREPVSRELSVYNHKTARYLQNNSESDLHSDIARQDGSVLPFYEHIYNVINCIQDLGDGRCGSKWDIADASDYAHYLSEWLKFLNRKNLLLLSYDEFEENPRITEDRIRQFLSFNFTGTTRYSTTTTRTLFQRIKSQSHSNVTYETKSPTCYSQKQLNVVFGPTNHQLFQLLNNNPGPEAEQRPFPHFSQIECEEGDETIEKGIQKLYLEQFEFDDDSMVLPNVLLIGAQKAGTSAIAEWLFDAGVCRPRAFDGEPWYYNKEVQFFDQPHRYHKGVGFYAKRFQQCNSSQYAMDATPNTISFPDHVESIFKSAGESHLRKLKVIVVLREPVSRELSLYNHKVFEYMETKAKDQWYSDVSAGNTSVVPFTKYLDILVRDIEKPGPWGMEWGLADTGVYVKHLRKWLSFLDRKQLLAIPYDEFKHDPRSVEKRIRQFLGVNFEGSTPYTNVLDNTEKVEWPSCHAVDRLNDLFDEKNKELYELLNSKSGPSAELKPFPEFKKQKCAETDIKIEYKQSFSEAFTGALKTGTSAIAKWFFGMSGNDESTDTHTQSKLVLPNVLLAGAVRGGTSAISEWLFENGVCRASVNDGEPSTYSSQVHFFDQQGRFEQGLDFYAERYQQCDGSALVMDATPNIITFPANVEAIYREAGEENLKNLKLILVVREPVSRELSLYNDKVEQYKESETKSQWYSDVSTADGTVIPFREYVDTVLKGIKKPVQSDLEWGAADTSHYARHLKAWLRFVDRQNILILSYDEFKNDHKSTEGRIRKFLGHDFEGSTLYTGDPASDQQVEMPTCYSQQKLNEVFGPMNQELYDLLTLPGPEAEQKPFPAFKQLDCAGKGVIPVLQQEKYGGGNSTALVLPNVLLIGARHSGTSAIRTWLFDNLVCAPFVFEGEPSK